MARSSLRGSDIRLVTGELFSPQRISRQSLDGRFWRWRTLLSTEWAFHSLLTALELEAVLLELRRRPRDPRCHGFKFLHLVDSQVALSAMSKHRSSSRVLNRILRRTNAICLASHLRPIFAFIRSEHNPSDWPSRRPRKRRRTNDGGS